MPAVRLAPGTILSGRYQVGEALGESDLGAVYRATDQRGQTLVALKVFHPAVKARAAALSEYQAQARQASGLGVEGIARAYDFGIDANHGVPFSTAECIGWTSLDRRVLAQGPVGVADLARALEVLGRALDAAHSTGLLHRDLKPQNVFISPDNPEWARLTDFGVGAVRRGAPEAMGWGGPPGYTPPDAVDAAAPSSPGADLFALGVVAFFALTRGTPFRSLRSPSFDPNAHWSELNQSLSPISERAKEMGVALEPALDAWFSRALALDPRERFASAGEMSRELRAVVDRLGVRGGGTRSLPGIAAAIAQPLVFQPEPSPASLGLASTSRVTTAAMAAVAAAPLPPAQLASESSLSPPSEAPSPAGKKSLVLPLMAGLGVILLSGLALAGYAVLGTRAEPSTTAPASEASQFSLPSPPPPPSVAASVPTPATTAPAATAPEALPPETPFPARAKTAAPTTTAPVAKTATSSSTKAAAAPTAKPDGSVTRKDAAAAASSKPVPGSAAVKTTAAAKSAKKKCSAFLGCK